MNNGVAKPSYGTDSHATNLTKEIFAEERVFTTSELADLLGINSYILNNWVRDGLISPLPAARHGLRSRRKFAEQSLCDAFFVRRLHRAGVKTAHIKTALKTFQMLRFEASPLKNPLVIHDRKMLLILCRSAKGEPVLLDVSQPGQQVLVCALDTVQEELMRALAATK